jgi:hypothetical protein
MRYQLTGSTLPMLLHLRARRCARHAGLLPLEPYPGAGTPWRYLCATCMREAAIRYGAFRDGRDGCKFCSWGANGIDSGPWVRSSRASRDLCVLLGFQLGPGKRPASQIRGSKRMWLVAAVLINSAGVGSLSCFASGRRRHTEGDELAAPGKG